MKLRLGGAAALLAALLPAAVAAAAGPALYLDLGSGVHPAAYRARSYSDTASVRIFADLANLPSKVEGFEFYVAFPCTVTNPCAVRRDADVVSFEPDTSLIGSSERRLCDELCACNQCESPSHFRLHIRTDRLSTVPADLRAPIGTLHLRGTKATGKVDLHFEIARFWVFGSSPLETRVVDVAPGNTATFGGVTPDGKTRWGVLKMMYR